VTAAERECSGRGENGFIPAAEPSEGNAVKKLALLAAFLEIAEPFAFRLPDCRPQ